MGPQFCDFHVKCKCLVLTLQSVGIHLEVTVMSDEPTQKDDFVHVDSHDNWGTRFGWIWMLEKNPIMTLLCLGREKLLEEPNQMLLCCGLRCVILEWP